MKLYKEQEVDFINRLDEMEKYVKQLQEQKENLSKSTINIPNMTAFLEQNIKNAHKKALIISIQTQNNDNFMNYLKYLTEHAPTPQQLEEQLQQQQQFINSANVNQIDLTQREI